MKTILATALIFSTLTFTLINCSNTSTAKKEQFEGDLMYSVQVIPNTTNKEYNDYQVQKYGTQLKITYDKSGNIKREYIGSGPNGLDYFFYLAASNTYYSKWKNIDTLFVDDAGVNMLNKLDEHELANTSILNVSCKGFQISGIEPKTKQKAILSYYYPEDKEFLDPKLYAKYKDFFTNRVMKKMQAPYYKLEMNLSYYVVIFELTKINARSVNATEFELPTDIPISKMK